MTGARWAGRGWRPRLLARHRRRIQVLAFLSPWIVGFLAFTAIPMGTSLYVSFTHYDVLTSPRWAGLDNYRFMFGDDPLFWRAVGNTGWMIVVALPVQLLVALGVATVLARPRRGAATYRTILFLPSLAPTVAAALAFVHLLDPGVGPLNRALGFLSLPEPLWFDDPSFAKPGLALLGLWTVGPTVVLLLAGIGRVPAELYDVVAVEGASRWQRFRHVTLPGLAPVLLFVAVMGVIQAFQQFAQAYVVTGATADLGERHLGSPEGSTLFYAVWLYRQGFEGFRMGYASAMAWVLLIVSLACVAIIVRTMARWMPPTGLVR